MTILLLLGKIACMYKLDKNCVITSRKYNKELEKYICPDLNHFGKFLSILYFSCYFTQK